jgi:hypothetical protein
VSVEMAIMRPGAARGGMTAGIDARTISEEPSGRKR